MPTMSPITDAHCGSALGSSMTTLVENGVEVLPTGPTLYCFCFSWLADWAARPGVAVPFSTATLFWLGGQGPLLFLPQLAVLEAPEPPVFFLSPQAIPARRGGAPPMCP